MERLNKRYVTVKNGYCFWKGKRILDAVKFKVTITPGTSTGRVLGETTPDTRWNGTMEIKTEITRRRTTPWAKELIKEYMRTKKTPELTLSGVLDDADSDYQEAYGKDSVTVVGCVPIGDITLLELDVDGEYLDDAITCNCKDIKFK